MITSATDAEDTRRSTRGRPLIVFFHGTGQSGSRMRRFSGASFDSLADTADAVVVYPDGYHKDWNGARVSETRAHRDDVDDVAFFNALVEELVRSEGAAADRVYVVGFSLGGQMVMRLLHEVPERLAGAVIISSTQPGPEIFQADRRDGGAPVPTVIFHGTADPLAPYNGGEVSLHGLFSRGRHLSAPDTAAYYAARNGHTEPPVTQPLQHPDGTASNTIATTTYGADTDVPVVLVSIDGGGHQVPNPRHVPTPWFWGKSSPEIVCADVVADRFALLAH